jgi:hypothetical protein
MLTLASMTWVFKMWNEAVSMSMYNEYRDIQWDIAPRTKLIRHPIFNEFLCTELQVPMNQDTATFHHDNSIPPVEYCTYHGRIDERYTEENLLTSNIA